MNRRNVLAGGGLLVGSLLAGCIEDGTDTTAPTNGDPGTDDPGTDDPGTDDPGTDDPGTDDPGTGENDGSAATLERRVFVTEVDGVPDAVPVDFRVRVLENAITQEGTAVLEAVVTNTGETERRVQTPYYKGSSDNVPGILLYSVKAPDRPSKDETPPCFEDSSPSQEFLEWTDEGPLSHTLAPGETERSELLVADDPTLDGCFQPGSYRFETDHSIDGEEFTWGFTIEITTGDGHTHEEPTDRPYEECTREVIPYDQFPADVQTEIDAALEGRYEADRVYLRDAMAIDRSYVSIGDTYYDPTVTVEDYREVLTLEVVEPKSLPRARSVSVTHDREGERTIRVEIIADDGTTLLEETRDLWAGGDIEYGRIARVGSHELRVTIEHDGEIEDEITRQVRIDESHFDVIVVVESDDVYVTGAVAELVVCRYDG
ncbi:MAG: hypothetical protein ACQETB_07605 [Halobacteriota archaeon]